MRILKVNVITGALILISIIIYLIYQNKMYGYSIDFEVCKNYRFFFKESFLKDIDSNGSSFIGNRNTLNNYVYKKDLKHGTAGANIDIWEFENLGNIELKDVKFQKSVSYIEIPNEERIVLYSGSRLERVTKRNVHFQSKLKIKIDNSDSVIQKYVSENYVGIYGDFTYIDIYNETGLQIKFRNDLDSKRTAFLVYIKKQFIYFIVLSSDKMIHNNLIDSLNLN